MLTKEKVKLNLGCGSKLWDGFTNVDKHYDKADVRADANNLPFEDGEASEIHAIHLIEHFYLWEVDKVLREWKRVLEDGGLLVLELPDLEKVLPLFFQPNPKVNETMWALYGTPDGNNPAMCHHWAYSFNMLREILEGVGFDKITKCEPKFHMKGRDMRIEARK